MSASGNASPSLHRLESALDDDDGDEVNWSIELKSRPIWRSGSLGFSSPQQDFKRRQKFVFAASLRSVAAEFESSQP
jgi:hypothetical protein